MTWIDIEDEQPADGDRVVVLLPFGMRVMDDTFVNGEWLNNNGYASHWQPIDAPGTYAEIMTRPGGRRKPVLGDCEVAEAVEGEIFSRAVNEHLKMMSGIVATQILLRIEATCD